MKMNVAYIYNSLQTIPMMKQKIQAHPFELSESSLGVFLFVEFLEASHLRSSHPDSFQVFLFYILKYMQSVDNEAWQNTPCYTQQGVMCCVPTYCK